MDWSRYLDESETIRWEGRPAPRAFTFRNWKHSLVGFLLLVLALFWESVGLQLKAVYDTPLVFWAPIPFILVGLYLSIGHLFLARIEWEKVYYAVTDRQVLVQKGLFRRRVEQMSLADLTYFRVRPLGAELGTVQLCSGEGDRALVVSCIEYPRQMTRLLEDALEQNGIDCTIRSG